MFLMGLDLGQATDPTAIAIVECQGTPQTVAVPVRRYSQTLGQYGWVSKEAAFEGPPGQFAVRHLDRLPLRTAYPAVAERVRSLFLQLTKPCTVVADATGVGQAVVDLLCGMGLPVLAVVITAGAEVGLLEGGRVTVPKDDLVATVAVGLQTGRLKVASTLPLAEVLAEELSRFEVRVTAAANAVYGAPGGAHDDLVIAVALACWAGESWYRREREVDVQQGPEYWARY